ncbi:MAG: tRNA 2-thiouridine(34) synthase MnmA [Ilumatobacteraceae bacterium]|nr:tRNA 2-thiouridine(34) synthase MnmA [Ilumatobacteraceae bacterium]
MSGGVDSSIAAAMLRDDGHQVVGVTLRLWGGDSDSGCCSVSDVDDARRVAQQLGIDHLVFNFADDFDRHVVAPYVADHAVGRTPNPCIECNRHLKFDRLLERARVLGFDAVATGHHARVVRSRDGGHRLERGADRAKDQSYVVHVLDQSALARVLMPVGALTKAEVRARATELGLRTAAKPDSQDVCFVTASDGRHGFLGRRIELHPAEVVDDTGAPVGRVDAVELVTLGQRRGLGLPGGGPPRFAVEVDVAGRRVVVGDRSQLLDPVTYVDRVGWTSEPVVGDVLVQTSAHGRSSAAHVRPDGAGGAVVRWEEPHPRVAAGQSVVLYDLDDRVVLGGGISRRAGAEPRPSAAPHPVGRD